MGEPYSIIIIGRRDRTSGSSLLPREGGTVLRWSSALILAGVLVSAPVMAATTLWEEIGEHAQAFMGYGACGGFDFDSDGLNDFLFASGDFGVDERQGAGKVYIRSGADNSLLFAMVGQDKGNFLGSAGAPIGRINRDGVEDFVITAAGFDEGFGRIYVLAGGSGALIFAKEGRALGLDGTSGFGDSVARSPGDWDGDGFSDIAAAAWKQTFGNGRIYIWSGRRPRRTLLIKDGTAGGGLGQSIAFADVNNDGFSDLIASESFPLGGGRGRVHVLLGPRGRRARYSPILGENDGDAFGTQVANLGDFDGDTIDDFAVSAPGFTGDLEFQGQIYVYSGVNGSLIAAVRGGAARQQLGLALSGAGDFNADGFADVAFRVHGPLPRSVAVMPGPDLGEGVPLIVYSQPPVSFGANLCPVGDTNGDSFDELLIADPTDSTAGLHAGKIYIESFNP